MVDAIVGQLLDHLPRTPALVEARGALGMENVELFEFDPGPPVSAVFLNRSWGTGSVLGLPAEESIRKLARDADEILFFGDDPGLVASALPDWSGERAILHAHPRPTELATHPSATRMLDLANMPELGHLPDDLVAELADAVAETAAIAASFDGEVPVAFCYAGSVSEDFWDVSIDTIESHRRLGHAERSFRRMAAWWLERDRAPVWGAVLSNHASMGLAKKLGFEPCGDIWVFTPSAS